jgi:uncharacterized membrane protein YuzA (DUF378 family)
MNKYLNLILVILVLVASVNYGLIGAFKFNLFSWLSQVTVNSEPLERSFYVLLGLIPFVLLYYANSQ